MPAVDASNNFLCLNGELLRTLIVTPCRLSIGSHLMLECASATTLEVLCNWSISIYQSVYLPGI